MASIDPITLAVIQGMLESVQREMTSTVEKTSRSSVFNIARDYSNALFNGAAEMILQGQDIPIHLGSLMPAMRTVADYFEGEINPGDIFYHNDPAWNGSHIVDCCMYKPVFYPDENGVDELVFWTVSKGHVTDIGGPVPAGQDFRTGEEYVSMLLATLISGGGATHQMDGWPAVGPQCCFGALTSGDTEILESQYPIIIHRYGLMTDSGGAGKFRGGSGTHWEVEPLHDPMTVIMFGEGRRYAAPGALGARSALPEPKVGRAFQAAWEEYGVRVEE
jgi:N-methylhydantoinase B/oxoprolinase/acetone carboxylase alpha subunit